jgi:epoxyqueuosine reductase QueG
MKNKLKKLIKEQGDLLFGVADVSSFKSYWLELPEKAVSSLNYGISIGIPLARGVLRSIDSAPTRLYSYHYKQINYFLDRLGVLVTNFVQSEGFSALPIPASQTLDHTKQKAHLSHKAIGIAAGLGWKGRNNLLVNPKYGSAIRLVTILTDMPLEADKPLSQDCGVCQKCIQLCPAGSIKIDPKEFDMEGCYKKLCEFQKIPGVGHHICGICVSACTGSK